jgi:hypothetical protein
MIGYIISGLCVVCGACLAGMNSLAEVNSNAWIWFLVAGTMMFLASAGAEAKNK